MGSILIRNIDDELKTRLRVRAAGKGRSMEAEARDILSRELEVSRPAEDLVDLAERLFGEKWGVDLDIEPRVPLPEPVRFVE